MTEPFEMNYIDDENGGNILKPKITKIPPSKFHVADGQQSTKKQQTPNILLSHPKTDEVKKSKRIMNKPLPIIN
ncbi:hypothetical protein BLA29_015209, partial [Euroglyphus maynei]